jgi:hypothetical protein
MYRAHPALSQSRIKEILRNNFKPTERDSPAMILGSLVDTILEDKDLISERYYVLNAKIGEKPKKIADKLIEKEYTSLSDVNFTEFYMLFDIFDYNNRYKDPQDPRRLDSFISEAQEYFDFIVSNHGKKAISQEDLDLAEQVANDMKTGVFSRDFFNHGLKDFNQLPLLFDCQDVNCKSLLDYVIVNDTDETVIFRSSKIQIKPGQILPVDYKTMSGHTAHFPHDVRKYRLDIQAAFYKEALTQNMPGFEILNMVFLVVSTTTPNCPYPYMISDKDLHIGRWGGNRVNGAVEINQNTGNDSAAVKNDINGYEHGVYLYRQHSYYDQWDYSHEQVMNGFLTTESY